APPGDGGINYTLVVRRTVLDALLVDAAVEAGAELREAFSVQDLVGDGDRVTGVVGRRGAGTRVAERATLVVGADGWRSTVARLVGAPIYHELPSLSINAYSYWSDLPVDGLGLFARPGRFLIAGATHDGLTLVQAVIAPDDEAAFRADIDHAFADTVRAIPALADHFPGATRQERFRLVTHLPNGFRKPYGPGWALVGDAGYVKDPVTAQGMGDAFRDAETLVDAIDAVLSHGADPVEAFATYARRRDAAAAAMYELTARLARVHEPPPPEMVSVLAAAAADGQQAERFLGVIAGTVPVDDVFPPKPAQVGSHS
ncbi:MAG TPA: FAD-dependent oxidoreductase, partial [Acidimicrobiales bacterium]|nr:FAD-dependent oxidoreductase [Acidimicrobiales bacterium]